MNCEHKFEKIGEVIETWTDRPFGRDYEKIQEMKCKNCGITTYYPIEAFGETN